MLADLLPWLNLLAVPTFGLVMTINSRLARLEATQDAHDKRLTRLESQIG